MNTWQGQGGSVLERGELRYNQDGYLFASGFLERHFENLIHYRFRGQNGDNFFLHTLFKQFDQRRFQIGGKYMQWRVQGKMRNALVVDTGGVGTTGGATLSVTFQAGAQTVQKDDVLVVPNASKLLNLIVTDASGWPTVVVKKVDGTNFAAGDVSVGDSLAFSHNSFGEGTGQPKGREWTPEEFSAGMGIVKSSCKFTGDAMTEMTEFALPNGERTWMYHNQYNTMMEHYRSVQNMLFNSERNDDETAAPQSPGGILNTIMANPATAETYTGAANETPLKQSLLNMNTLNEDEEFLLLCGQDLFYDLQDSLSALYHTDGAVNYGTFGQNAALAAGQRVVTYMIGNKTLHLKHFRHFDNADDLGAPAGGASATSTDFSKFGLLINMGTDRGATAVNAMANGLGGVQGLPKIFYFSKMHNGIDRSLVVGHLPGMTGMQQSVGAQLMNSSNAEVLMSAALQNMVSTDIDEDQFFALTQAGVGLVDPDYNHGTIRAVG